jgi:hypothetical protein
MLYSISDLSACYKFATAELECFRVLADGEALIKILDFFLNKLRGDQTSIISNGSNIPLERLFTSIRRVVKIPTIRVINLFRRNDRLRLFHCQAMREGLIVVLGVADLTEDESYPSCFGKQAFDGTGRLAEAMKRLTTQVKGPAALKTFVDIQWRPNDLRPFDKDAPRHENLVRMTASEVGCALSHIAAWKGALRSLRLSVPEETDYDSNALFRNPLHLRRAMLIAGFAQGPAMDAKNADMSPAPVCAILEDDAVFVDRFQERLNDLLLELPRDFHFCSLGYGRPKTAPIGRYSPHCGVPSHVFYMTGYLLSLAGAEYLLNSLPVVGPVDSWIGLKMTSNFDNVFGTQMGVGIQSRPLMELPSRKDLCRVLQFRAFCALQPLCSQRVGTQPSSDFSPPANRSWRQRDTDIKYSGDRNVDRR